MYLQESVTGGIELAPILAAKKNESTKWPLYTSDVTRIYDPKSK